METPVVYCQACGKEMSSQAMARPQCGHPSGVQAGAPAGQATAIHGPPKSRVVAGVLGLLVGGLGIHKFYLGKVGLGILYLLFVWTFIPAIIGFIEGIIYLVQSDSEFSAKQGVVVQS